jgi:16S rRNA (adenine1518-N6/adenine1519-N6)-dimethyltransferase
VPTRRPPKASARKTKATARNVKTSARPAPALAAAGVRPSKSRGQNFLVNPAVAERIVAAANLEPGDEVLEIGPGLGILTENIVEQPIRRLVLVELDARLAERLALRFVELEMVRVVNDDFLHLDLTADYLSPPLVVIGNLPFNVAAAILRRLSDNAAMFTRMVLMFQREVAERIRARLGDAGYSALSVYTALYWKIDLHFRVAAGSFHPRPKVDAEVMRFVPRENRVFAPDEEATLLAVIRAAFSAPRKTIRNTLAGGLKLSADRIADALEAARIKPAARAETLGVEDFARLARILRGDLQTLDTHDA